MTMTPAQWERLEALFSEAVDLEPDALHELLERECGQDQELKSRVRQLVREDRSEPTVLRKTVRYAWSRLLRDLSQERTEKSADGGSDDVYPDDAYRDDA